MILNCDCVAFQNCVHHTSLSFSTGHYPWRRFQEQFCEMATRNTHKFLMFNFWSVQLLQRGEDFLLSRWIVRNRQKEGTNTGVFSCLTVSQCSCLAWRKKASYVFLKGGEAWVVLTSCAIGFFEISRYVIFSRPPLWAAQFCHVPRLWLGSATSGKVFKSGFFALGKWVWDFYCYFVKCLNDFWAIVVLVSVSMMFQCLKTCRGKCSLHSLNFFSFLPSYSFSVNVSLCTREIEGGVCFILKNNILVK